MAEIRTQADLTEPEEDEAEERTILRTLNITVILAGLAVILSAGHIKKTLSRQGRKKAKVDSVVGVVNPQPVRTYLLGRNAILVHVDGDGLVDGIRMSGHHYGLEWVAKGYENRVRGYLPNRTKVMSPAFRRAVSDLSGAHQRVDAHLRGSAKK